MADGKRGELRTQVDHAARLRDGAVREFQAFAATGLLRAALPTLEYPMRRSRGWRRRRALARAVNAELDAVDDGDGPWDRVQRRVSRSTSCQDAMARPAPGRPDPGGGRHRDRRGVPRPHHDLPWLAEALEAEVTQRTRLLSARRELLENHLVSEVAGTLQELISEAEAEVRQMNDELMPGPRRPV